MQNAEKNGGVFWGRPEPTRGCSAIDGNGSSLESLTNLFRQLNSYVDEMP